MSASYLSSGLSEPEFSKLESFVHTSLIDIGAPVLSLPTVTRILLDYSRLHSLPAMLHYIDWAKHNNELLGNIMSTIMHDLNGMHDRCFSPRTAAYLNIPLE